jgi:cytochrome c oxidase accessory protein FixG
MASQPAPYANHPVTGRPRVQTKWIWGAHERRRWTVFAAKFAVFLVLPWIAVGGAPALFFDVTARKFHVFGQVFWPQDFYLLGLFLAISALLLVITTSLVGRVWCGYACPQTLLTSLFMVIDHAIEGDRARRILMDKGTMTKSQRFRRLLKHKVWLLVAAFFGFTFTCYFFSAVSMVNGVATLTLSTGALALWAFITAITYLDAGHLRDWVCTTVCPYGRLQGAMQDTDSLIVTYDKTRGEPRGKGKAVIERGGCVDCNQCVNACPMGIDIRKGYQYECITCSRCIDACNDTMSRIGAAPDLIRYASWNEAEAHEKAPETPWPTARNRKWWRPRPTLYAVALVGLVGVTAGMVVTRPLLTLEASRDRVRMLQLADGRVSNLYTLKLINKDTRPHTVKLELSGLDGQLLGGETPLVLAPGSFQELSASVVVKSVDPHVARTFEFNLRDVDTGALKDQADASFVVPVQLPRSGRPS